VPRRSFSSFFFFSVLAAIGGVGHCLAVGSPGLTVTTKWVIFWDQGSHFG
jgi:hypothetical protein